MNYTTDLNVKLYLLTLLTGLLLCGCPSCNNNTAGGATNESERRPPNILFAIADDASWKHFGAYGCDWVETPAFDRVAAAGLLFANAYTPNAKCAPSRSCILTGRNPWQLEEAANHSPHFPAKFTTYVEALGAHGYWTGATGKGWAPGNPGMRDGKARELAGPKFDAFTTRPPARFMSNNDYAQNFATFLEARPAGQPFCFWYGSTEPHRAYEFGAGVAHGKELSDIDEVPPFWPDVDSVRTDMLDYAFEIEYFDHHLQRMLALLEEAGELDNTIVVVTADNGMPFPRIKGQVYEYSNHLPLAVMWPDGIQNPGRTVTEFVNFIDFAPTFLAAADLTVKASGMQDITGNSLLDIFTGEGGKDIASNRDHVLVGKERHDVGRPNDAGYPVRGLIQDGFLYLHNFKPDRWPVGNPITGYLNTDGSPTKSYLLNTHRYGNEREWWALNFGKRVEEELYDIRADPYCMTNLANDARYTERKQSMSASMTVELMAQNDPRILGNGDVFDQYPYSGAVQDLYNRFIAGERVPTGWVNDSDYEAADPE
ncbi:arylsulfatase A-like enzyme [Lewinella aquimaris]|uniref:Arylsulfatase A-like enzyme n=1 Tax=Neolewinella aquimaris TaxID=1835722 RepID=A0A840E7I1_9BACT|nr:sulfatase [Neolewinella aquimaris]MBB4078018.1 arylsulfatase A-like enzyme [Neolewinella aquimaris]